MTATAAQESAPNIVRRKVLLVEDSALILMSLEALFDDMDWDVDGPAMRLSDALALAETTVADIALLDVNLDGEFSWEVAERLRARGVPVVFATGYNSSALAPEHLRDVPVVGKPFAVNELELLLRQTVGDAA